MKQSRPFYRLNAHRHPTAVRLHTCVNITRTPIYVQLCEIYTIIF